MQMAVVKDIPSPRLFVLASRFGNDPAAHVMARDVR